MSKHIIFMLVKHLTPFVNFAQKYLNIILHIIYQKSNQMLTYYYNACCICKEVYNLEERKPFVLPCSHIFCQSCLQKMQAKNNWLCPICERVWSLQSIGGLAMVHQLVDSSNEMTKMTKCNSSGHVNISAARNVELVLWCKKCKVSICNQCLIEDHKTCDWVLLEEVTGNIQVNLKESVSNARSILNEKISRETTENNSKLTDMRKNITKLKCHEETLVSFSKILSEKKDKATQLLKYCDSILSNGSVNDLKSTISEVLSLLNDKITPPYIPKFVILNSEQLEGGIDFEDPTDDHNLDLPADGCQGEDSAEGYNLEGYN